VPGIDKLKSSQTVQDAIKNSGEHFRRGTFAKELVDAPEEEREIRIARRNAREGSL
jgi:hypothetical protein